MSQKPDEKFKLPLALWRGIELLGLAPAAVLRHARLPVTLHLRDKSLVNTAQFFSLWQALETLSGDPAMGIKLASRLDTSVLPPSSLAAFYARDYRDGLTRLARFKALCAPERMDIVEQGEECLITVEWLQSGADEPSTLIDATFTSFIELGRRGTGWSIAPRRVELKRPESDGSAHRDYFTCPVRFGATRNALILNSSDLDRSFSTHNAEMLEILGPALSAALGELQARSSISDQIKVVLKHSLASGRPELCDVASEPY